MKCAANAASAKPLTDPRNRPQTASTLPPMSEAWPFHVAHVDRGMIGSLTGRRR